MKFTTMQALTRLKHDVSHASVQYNRGWDGFGLLFARDTKEDFNQVWRLSDTVLPYLAVIAKISFG